MPSLDALGDWILFSGCEVVGRAYTRYHALLEARVYSLTHGWNDHPLTHLVELSAPARLDGNDICRGWRDLGWLK